MGLVKEFREFALKGNMVDMAVGIVIGAGFSGVVNAFVEKVIMPCVGLLGGVDFSGYDIRIGGPDDKPVMLGVGSFLTALLQFLIVAFAIFMVVKALNSARKRFEQQKEEAPKAPPEDVQLLREIRDSLRNR